MNPQEFEKQWLSLPDERLNKFDPDLFKAYAIDDATFNFLTTVGLPAPAAPYLNFGSEYFREWNRLLLIGGLGHKSYIGISPEKSCMVYAVDGEGKNQSFVNSSVEQLASFLLIYRAFVNHIITERGEQPGSIVISPMRNLSSWNLSLLR